MKDVGHDERHRASIALAPILGHARRMRVLRLLTVASLFLACDCKRPGSRNDDAAAPDAGAIAEIDEKERSPVRAPLSTPAEFWSWFSARQDALTWPPPR